MAASQRSTNNSDPTRVALIQIAIPDFRSTEQKMSIIVCDASMCWAALFDGIRS